MKDFNAIWRGIFGTTYDAVNNRDEQKNIKKQEIKRRVKQFRTRRCALIYASLGIGAILSALFILIIDPYSKIYDWKLVFGPGGEIYSLWQRPPVELYLKVYLWNITNKDEYMNGIDKKLKFQEVGPYVYREHMSHENVTFNDNGTLTTNPNHPLEWQPELSEGRKEDDLLILPNIALLSIADVVSKKSFITRLGLNLIIRQTRSAPLVQMTAREFMFGYKNALMDLGNTFMPSWIYFDKLGLIDRMYEFRGDFETVYTGTKLGLSNIGLIDTYNGDTKIPQWDSPCGDISGASDGTKFPGKIKPNDTLLFFRKSMCRAKTLIQVNETMVKGLKAYVYNFAPDSDDNGRIHEKNRCFCKSQSIDECLPNGLLDVRGCYYGFPIALSYPHFLDTDKVAFNKVESGLNPDPSKHKSYFVIQPESGLPINVAVRYQINMALGSIQNIANTERFANMVLPLLWTEIGMYDLPGNLNLLFKLYLQILPTAQTCVMYALFLLGIASLIYSIFLCFKSKQVKNIDAEHNWIEDINLDIDRKISSYIPEKRSSLTPLELREYLSSLIAPVDQQLSNY
ncbi:scavenger receptor class B member 1-like isoform X2 [Rhynchophorus ferrugineus]|uniref:scavenger receptor class B member 1-like isoform X2 n=1 Tax=Rhynchophorus ferrugineus TaxID=354439 RepID=UPI003FCDB632